MRIHPKLSERDCLPMPYAVRSDWQETSGEDLVKLVHRQFMDNAEQAEDWRAKRCGELIRGGGLPSGCYQRLISRVASFIS